VVVESEPLARSLATAIERDMLPQNAWRVSLNDGGRLEWVAGEQKLHRQPARGPWQRLQDIFFMMLPVSLY